ncbi:MAG: hypothetical protein PHD43_14960 [Methylococcales bacterium]|nr:hypothetical protein [Methylococcales bacterium]
MATWFEQNAVDLIGHALTVVGIIGAAATVVWQLGRQHQSSLLLQRDNAREELKLRLHELLVQKVRRLSNANVEAAMYAYMIPFNVENFQRQLAQGLYPTPIKERAPDFSRLHAEANNALIELIQEFEAWSIAFPGLEVFQVALNVANHDAREAFAPLFTALLRVLPFDPPDDAPPNVPRPLIQPLIQSPISSEEYAQLKILVERYKEAMDEIGSYVHDLTIESQNNLLSELFERRVPPRQPIDPRLKVISTDPEKVAQLLSYFENETSWGNAKRAAETNARAKLD